MTVMIDSSHSLDECEEELGCHVEQLFTPLTRRDAQRPDDHFAIDNGSFSKFSKTLFLSCIEKHLVRKHLCRWVAVPDVVGSAIRTIECFDVWSKRLEGWPLAFVCQDGQEKLPIPWDKIQCVFIGGSTEWKLSEHAVQIIKTAIILDKMSHIGRVNTPGRFEYFENIGATSCDGTGVARFTGHRLKIKNNNSHPRFNFEEL